MKKHYTIPFFIPLAGCPNKCVFCDQHKITGEDMPSPDSVPEKIEKYLSTMPKQGVRIEVGFFGGSFTGIPVSMQQDFLEKTGEYFKKGLIHGIRLSTRPDLIDEKVVSFLKENGVTRIELGIQSMSDEVLKAAKRGHTARDAERASRTILAAGISLGHQMMVGLPESTLDNEMYTARKIKDMGADEVRIYPVIVIKGTELAAMWVRNSFVPLSLEAGLERAARLILYFDSNNIRVIRCGLHPSDGLISGEEYLAGPFHPAFGQKARERAKSFTK